MECYENISSCQEAILVLENYVRDFKALAEWFRVSWDYDSKPQQQLSLAWDVRKSNPMPSKFKEKLFNCFLLNMPFFLGLRAKSLSSPSPPILSGKSSPCPSYSGKSSPCSASDDVKSSPRKKFLEQLANAAASNNETTLKISNATSDSFNKPLKSPRSQLTKIKEDSPPNPGTDQHEAKTTELNDEKPTELNEPQVDWNDMIEMEDRMKDMSVEKKHQYSQTDLEDDNLTLVQWREKYEKPQTAHEVEPIQEEPPEIIPAAEMTVNKLNEMESEFLAQQSIKATDSIFIKPNEASAVKPSTLSAPKSPKNIGTKSPEFATGITKTPDKKPGTTIVPSTKYANVVNRPATSSTVIRPNLVTSRSATMIRSSRFSNPVVKSMSNPIVPVTTIRKPLAKPACPAVGSSRNIAQNVQKSHVPESAKSKDPPNNNRRILGGPPHIANRITARSKTMIDISNKNLKNFSNSHFARRSRDDIASSSSTLKASTEHISANTSRRGSVKNLNQSTATRNDVKYRRSEPKSVTATEENDGWLTVKAKRRSSLHWANRFNQPTGYASLPTLIMPAKTEDAEKKDNETKVTKPNGQLKKDKKPIKKDDQVIKVIKQNKIDRSAVKAKSTLNSVAKVKIATSSANKETKKIQSQKSIPAKTVHLSSKLSVDGQDHATAARPSTSEIQTTRENLIQRQKSDLTGLKITKLHKEFMRNEKNNGKSSKPAAVVAPTISSTSPNSSKINDLMSKNQIDMNIQTNMGLSKAISDLYASCPPPLPLPEESDCVKENGLTDSLILTSSCDEMDDREDIESDEDQRKLLEEQELLEQQIRELENSEIDVDTETDETDCDCEVILDLEENDSNADIIDDHLSMDNEEMSLELRYQLLLSDMSLGERVETLATLQAFVSRHPGRAQELHKKLSSPSRRRSLHETLKKYQAKQVRAQAKREALMKEKAVKLQILLARVEDVKAAKQQLIEDKRMRMEERLQRATENRTQYLKDKIRKAHDEEAKLQEIAFIKNLEARIKRLDIIESWKEQEGRLQDLEQERQKRVEEKAAKEAAVERRRTELELERLRRLEKMNETR